MLDRAAISQKMRDHYESVWNRADPWGLSDSAFDGQRFERQLELLQDRRYATALEIGCGGGRFTRMLAPSCERLVALDIAPAAIARAREHVGDLPQVEFHAIDVMQYDVQAEGPWDLVVLSETIYSLGWLYPMFDVAWLAAQLFAATSPGGRLLLVNTYGRESDYLLAPWLIDTYRDLMLNIGYRRELEETLSGTKEGVSLTVLVSLLVKPADVSAESK